MLLLIVKFRLILEVNNLLPPESPRKNLFESERDHEIGNIQKRHNIIHPTILRLSSMHSSRKGQMYFGEKIESDVSNDLY